MSGLDKDRFRNKTVSFRMAPEECRALDARVKISGLPKNQFIIKALLQGEINIVVGKYQSDRLSLELKRLREGIQGLKSSSDFEELNEAMKQCETMLQELLKLTANANETNHLNPADFCTAK